MAKLSELRKQAKGMGIAPAAIRSATTAEELQSVIEDHQSHDGGTKVVAKAKAKAKTTGKRRGRPPGSKNKTASKSAVKRNSVRKASAPVKSRKSGTTKRQSTSSYVAKGGRNTLDRVNFSETDGWNPRDGSAPDRIIKALRKAKGNREKVFDALKSDMRDFVSSKKQNGEKRTKAESEDMLKWRISRTAFDFAIRTGQHEPSGNRVQYGTGGTGQGIFKPAKRRKTASVKRGAQKARKTASRKSASKSSSRKSTSQKRTQGRRKVASSRRGR